MRTSLFPLLFAVAFSSIPACRSSNPDGCPDGARLAGKAPPQGFAEWCARPDGKKHGRFTEWHPSGNRKSEGTFVDGKMNGRWLTWFADGTREREGVYKGGLKDGLWTLYYEGGGPKNRTEEHRAGALDVMWTAWRVDGSRWATGSLLASSPQGPYQEWHPNGKLAVQGNYDHGQKAGEWKYWDPDGKPTSTPQGDFLDQPAPRSARAH